MFPKKRRHQRRWQPHRPRHPKSVQGAAVVAAAAAEARANAKDVVIVQAQVNAAAKARQKPASHARRVKAAVGAMGAATRMTARQPTALSVRQQPRRVNREKVGVVVAAAAAAVVLVVIRPLLARVRIPKNWRKPRPSPIPSLVRRLARPPIQVHRRPTPVPHANRAKVAVVAEVARAAIGMPKRQTRPALRTRTTRTHPSRHKPKRSMPTLNLMPRQRRLTIVNAANATVDAAGAAAIVATAVATKPKPIPRRPKPRLRNRLRRR